MEIRRDLQRRKASPQTTSIHPSYPSNLKTLDVFIKRLQKQGSTLKNRADAACVCLAAAIESLHNAVAYFDKAVALSPDLLVAYRDRGLGYCRLAQCEAVLAAVQDSDPKSHAESKKLDHAWVDGRAHFHKAICQLVKAKEREAAIAAEKKDVASAEDAMAKNYIATAFKHDDSAAKGRKTTETTGPDQTDLPTVQKRLQQLRADAAAVKKLVGKEERKTRQALASANAELDASCIVLSNSAYLQQAKRSARIACEKSNFASAKA